MANKKSCDKCGGDYAPAVDKQSPVIAVPGTGGLPGGNMGVDLCDKCEGETTVADLRTIAAQRYVSVHKGG